MESHGSEKSDEGAVSDEATFNQYEALLQQGEAAAANGEYEKALAIFKKLSVQYVDLPEPYNKMGLIYVALKECENAKQAFQKAITLDSTCWKALNNLANLYDEEGNAELAIQCAEQAIQLVPKQLEVYGTLGVIYSKSNYVTAEAAFKQALFLNEEEPLILYHYAMLLGYKLERYAEAVALLLRFLENPVQHLVVSAHFHVASFYCYYLTSDHTPRDHEKVIYHFEQAILLQSEQAQLTEQSLYRAHAELGLSYSETHCYQEAIFNFYALLNLRPTHNLAALFSHLATAYHSLKQYEDAEKYYGLLLDLPDTLVEQTVRYNKLISFASCLYEQRQYAALIQLLESHDAHLPDNLTSQGAYFLAASYHWLNEFEKSVSFYQRYIQLKPEDPRGYLYLGRVYETLERYEELSELLLPILDSEIANTDIYHLAANLFTAQGDLERAQAYRYKALEFLSD